MLSQTACLRTLFPPRLSDPTIKRSIFVKNSFFNVSSSTSDIFTSRPTSWMNPENLLGYIDDGEESWFWALGHMLPFSHPSRVARGNTWRQAWRRTGSRKKFRPSNCDAMRSWWWPRYVGRLFTYSIYIWRLIDIGLFSGSARRTQFSVGASSRCCRQGRLCQSAWIESKGSKTLPRCSIFSDLYRIFESVKVSLERLQLDYVDVLQGKIYWFAVPRRFILMFEHL